MGAVTDQLLQVDQRLKWWELWSKVSNNVPDEIPKRLLKDDLFDVTVEPLLLYFVAFVRPWEFPSSLQGQFGRNWLYERLLREFYARECSKGIRNFALEFEQFDDYEVVLQAMALASWYDGSTRIGTIEVVDKLLRDWSKDAADAFRKVVGSEAPAVGAALAFYMKPGERPNSFEFLHKTFAEYLVARRLVDILDSFSSLITESSVSRASKRRPLEIGALLLDWLRFTGPRAIDKDLQFFLDDEIAARYSQDSKLVMEWKDASVKCMRNVLRDGFPGHVLMQLGEPHA